MTAACFVDANVLVYASDPGEAGKYEMAQTLLDRLWREQSGRTSMQALNEFYAVVTRKLRKAIAPELAWHDVEELLEWDPQPINAALLRQARGIEIHHRLNWWDCQIVAAAQLQDCAVLYTEDLHDGAVYGSVRIRNPFLAQVQEEPPAYEAPRVVSRHRGRGRPRKVA